MVSIVANMVSPFAAMGADVPSYTQTFEITYDSSGSATLATLTPLPVLDGKDWALSARWDDNHLGSIQMRDAMAKHGLKGTFYLNVTDKRGRLGSSFVKKLTQDGFSIGGHSQRHLFMPTLGPNAMVTEVLANRVEREAQANIPIVSFAFPFGRWKSSDDPTAATRIIQTLRRAGLHHNTYSRFATKNPNVGKFEFATTHLIVPGDSVINPVVFEKNLEKFFKFSKAYRKRSDSISLSTHARQKKTQLKKLDDLFAKLLTRTDWWICNQNENAAYFQQVHRSQIKRINVSGATARYQIIRPTPAWSGATVPLTLHVTGGQIKNVQGSPATHTWHVNKGRTLVNLGHDPTEVEPRLIDAIQNPDNHKASANEGKSVDFEGLCAWLVPDQAKAFNRKPHAFVVAVDFELDKTTPVKVISQMPVTHAFLNGSPVKTDATFTNVRRGINRLIAVLHVDDRRIFWKPELAWFELQAQGNALKYVLPVKRRGKMIPK